MIRSRMLVIGTVLSLLISACATMAPQSYQSAWQPMVRMNEPRPSAAMNSLEYTKKVEGYRNKYNNDMSKCRATAIQAASQVPQSSVLGGTVLGAIGGAVAGTVIGAAAGNPGKGAAIGAASGGVLGAGPGLWGAGGGREGQEWQFK